MHEDSRVSAVGVVVLWCSCVKQHKHRTVSSLTRAVRCGRAGREVVDCTEGGKLNVFRKMSYRELMDPPETRRRGSGAGGSAETKDTGSSSSTAAKQP